MGAIEVKPMDVLRGCLEEGEFFVPNRMRGDMDLPPTSDNGIKLTVLFGEALDYLHSHGYIEATIDPVHGLKKWTVTEAGKAALEIV